MSMPDHSKSVSRFCSVTVDTADIIIDKSPSIILPYFEMCIEATFRIISIVDRL